MNTKQLRKAAEEMITVMGLVDDDKNELTIPAKATDEDIEAVITGAIKYIDPKEDEFTPETQAVIDALKPAKKGKKTPAPTPEPDEPEPEPEEQNEHLELTTEEALLASVESAEEISELKSLVRNDDHFKSLRIKLISFKSLETLRSVMVGLLVKDLPAPAPEEKLASKKTAKPVKKAPVVEEETPEPEPPTTKAKAKDKEKPAVKKSAGTTEYFEKSNVIKGMRVGSKVKFTSAPNSKVAPSKELTGEVVVIKISPNRSDEEAVKINTKLGMFYKRSKSVELVK